MSNNAKGPLDGRTCDLKEDPVQKSPKGPLDGRTCDLKEDPEKRAQSLFSILRQVSAKCTPYVSLDFQHHEEEEVGTFG